MTLWSAVMGVLCLHLEKMERHLLKILSHHILVSVSQRQDMIQGDPGTLQEGTGSQLGSN